MDQPWGLSGAQFLALYAVGFVAAVIVMFVLQAVLARVGPRDVGSDVRLDVYDAAYLAGGPYRLVDTAIAALALRDKVLVGRNGRLTPVHGTTPAGPVEAAVYGVLTRTMSRRAVYRAMRHHPEVLAVDERVRARGLMLDGSRALLWRLVVALPVAVFLVGVARAVNGMNLNRPTGNLLALLALSVLVLFWVLLRRLRVRYRPSSAGRAALRTVRREHRVSSTGSRAGSVDVQMAGVAVLGYAAIADPALRSALVGSTSSSSGGSDGGSGCGSSCGGGGCGGGGCGG